MLGPAVSLHIPGVGDVTGATSQDVVVTETTTFLRVARNAGGAVERTATVRVVSSRPPVRQKENRR